MNSKIDEGSERLRVERHEGVGVVHGRQSAWLMLGDQPLAWLSLLPVELLERVEAATDASAWIVPKIAHDEERAVTPIVRETWIYRDAGTSSVAHTRFFAAQLLAAADELAARLAAVTPPSEGTQK